MPAKTGRQTYAELLAEEKEKVTAQARPSEKAMAMAAEIRNAKPEPIVEEKEKEKTVFSDDDYLFLREVIDEVLVLSNRVERLVAKAKAGLDMLAKTEFDNIQYAKRCLDSAGTSMLVREHKMFAEMFVVTEESE